jgi:hypothetical protein
MPPIVTARPQFAMLIQPTEFAVRGCPGLIALDVRRSVN